jgi:hypothetical protein
MILFLRRVTTSSTGNMQESARWNEAAALPGSEKATT